MVAAFADDPSSCSQRTMTLERVNRLVESAEVEAGVGEGTQNRPAQTDRRAWKGEALGTQQIAMSASDVATGRQHVIGLDHGCPGNRQRFAGRLRRGQGPLDVTPGSIGRAAQAVQVAQVLARQDFTAGFTRSDEAVGRDFEQRNRLGVVLRDRGLAEDQRRPWMLDIPAAEAAQPPASLVESAMLSPRAVETQQVGVRPVPSGRTLALREWRRGRLIGERR